MIRTFINFNKKGVCHGVLKTNDLTSVWNTEDTKLQVEGEIKDTITAGSYKLIKNKLVKRTQQEIDKDRLNNGCKELKLDKTK